MRSLRSTLYKLLRVEPEIKFRVEEELKAKRTRLELECDKLRDQYNKQVIPAFEIDGTQYYELPDIFSMPTQRAMAAMNYYEELRQCCDREYLIQYSDKQTEILNSGNIVLSDLFTMAKQLKERLQMIAAPDHIYKLASVVYFDKTENIEDYDFHYGNQKIAKWKKAKGSSFFLLQPVKKLIPSMNLSEHDLQDYLKVADQIQKKHLEDLSMI